MILAELIYKFSIFHRLLTYYLIKFKKTLDTSLHSTYTWVSNEPRHSYL